MVDSDPTRPKLFETVNDLASPEEPVTLILLTLIVASKSLVLVIVATSPDTITAGVEPLAGTSVCDTISPCLKWLPAVTVKSNDSVYALACDKSSINSTPVSKSSSLYSKRAHCNLYTGKLDNW